MKLRPGLVSGGVLVALMLTFFVGAATATGTGTFSGAITPTACGPMHELTVAQGDTTIDAVAAEDVSANDITLDLYAPSGALLVHGDTLTSPESVHYARADLAPGHLPPAGVSVPGRRRQLAVRLRRCLVGVERTAGRRASV